MEVEIDTDTRENVRRVIEALRLGETFDQYREAVAEELGKDAADFATRPELAISIADAFVEAAGWDEES